MAGVVYKPNPINMGIGYLVLGAFLFGTLVVGGLYWAWECAPWNG